MLSFRHLSHFDEDIQDNKEKQRRNRLKSLLERTTDNHCDKSHRGRKPTETTHQNQLPLSNPPNYRNLSDDQISYRKVLGTWDELEEEQPRYRKQKNTRTSKKDYGSTIVGSARVCLLVLEFYCVGRARKRKTGQQSRRNPTEVMTARRNPPVDCVNSPVRVTNEPARESGSLHFFNGVYAPSK
ncbi:hypothetical protein T05_15231 [Trichinella murrelli]|uniref:Uncharacterized protein n=1 Tax=Trichinella murrelli TaxID=144512 RepID=A0A0V0UEA1_9BILA|nr:hypothetical protein T05_15231 [Trichinella murrelli]